MEIYTPGVDANYQAQLEVEAARMRQQNPNHELRLSATELKGMGVGTQQTLSCTPLDNTDLKTYDPAHYFIHIPQGCDVPAVPFVLKLAELNNVTLAPNQIDMLSRQLSEDKNGIIWENGDDNIALNRGIRSQNDTRDPVEISVTNPDFSETTLKASPEAVIEIINEVTITKDIIEPSPTSALAAGVKAEAKLPIAVPIIQPTRKLTASPEEIQAYDTKISNLKAILGWLASIGAVGFFGFVLAAFRSQKGEKVNVATSEAPQQESLVSKRMFKNPKTLPLDEGLVAGTTTDPSRGYKVKGGAIHAKGFDPKGIQIAQKLDEVALEIASNPDKYPTGRGGRIPLQTARSAIKAVEERKNK